MAKARYLPPPPFFSGIKNDDGKAFIKIRGKKILIKDLNLEDRGFLKE